MSSESDHAEMMLALSGTWDGYRRDELEERWMPKTKVKQMPVEIEDEK